MSNASESSTAQVQNLLAQKQTATQNNDAAAVAAAAAAIAALGYS